MKILIQIPLIYIYEIMARSLSQLGRRSTSITAIPKTFGSNVNVHTVEKQTIRMKRLDYDHLIYNIIQH